MDFRYCRDVLEHAGVVFESGLSRAEVHDVEGRYSFLFPTDLKEFLMFALPISEGFLNWRHASDDEIVRRLAWPYDSMCFDIEHNVFWMDEWGERPAELSEAFATAKKAVDQAPVLIPIYSHRYIPDRPNESGNPILSVYQTDIIYYGTDLADYFENEFRDRGGRLDHVLNETFKQIEFWSLIVG